MTYNAPCSETFQNGHGSRITSGMKHTRRGICRIVNVICKSVASCSKSDENLMHPARNLPNRARNHCEESTACGGRQRRIRKSGVLYTVHIARAARYTLAQGARALRERRPGARSGGSGWPAAAQMLDRELRLSFYIEPSPFRPPSLPFPLCLSLPLRGQDCQGESL